MGIASAVGTVGIGGLWIAIHEIPWLGPALADGARSIVGPGPVAFAEDVAYGIADEINLLFRAEEPPKTFWEVPASTLPPEIAKDPSEPGQPEVFSPPGFEPPFTEVAATGDGVWLPVQPPGDNRTPAMWKTMVHPDPKRPFAAVAVVAIDTSQIELHLVAGTHEPKSFRIREEDRPGLIPGEQWSTLVGAFNGGFKAAHGNYGMKLADVEYLQPRDIACTLATDARGELVIQTWSELKARDSELTWYRQTPPCLIEGGEPNPGLLHEFNRNWGATVSGETIIRRSAIGLDQDGRLLFYALGDAVTAQSIGRAMQVVGSHSAAQLDVNYSYPRFLLFDRRGEEPTLADPLVPDVKFQPTDYTIGPSRRDFFYLTRQPGSDPSG